MAGNNLQGQLWIGTKDHLPYMASWVYLGDKSRPRTTLTYKNWKLNATVPASTFDSVRFSKALVTEFSHPEAPVK
jgi:outer membrane lipoprotein-sorting protein